MSMKLEIIHEDNDIILCHKPAGVATQTKRLGQQDMESLLKNYRVQKGEQPYIGVVHRLDQPVEGLMVFTKNKKAAAFLSKQIQQHMIGKYYYAVSEHTPEQLEGMLENYLVTDKKKNVTIVAEVCEDQLDKGTRSSKGQQDFSGVAKKAKLEYRVADSNEKGALFDIKLHTGRQHQIRVQFAYMGCPLVGDSKYGDMENGMGEVNRKTKSVASERESLALCSYRLEFIHPTTGKQMNFSIVPQGKAFERFHIA